MLLPRYESLLLTSLECRNHKVSPSITRVNLGEMASMMCHTDREAMWSLYSNEKLSDYMKTSGTLNQHFEIDQISMDDIGMYCCYGYDEEYNNSFLACSNVALLGKNHCAAIKFSIELPCSKLWKLEM